MRGKYLKALLAFRGSEFAKTHDLEALAARRVRTAVRAVLPRKLLRKKGGTRL
jgi:HEPN domain-containing protein